MSMGKRRIKKSASEQDAFSRFWRKHLCYRPGVSSEIKRGYRQKERARAKQNIREGEWES